jgi:hypothetical protein
MAKIIRHTYPANISIGLLLLIFAIAFFLSGQLFQLPGHPEQPLNVYLGMFLVSVAVLVMVLVLWEEFLFPVKVKPSDGGFVFRNHSSKLKKQILIYCIIPAIFIFLHLNYHVNQIRFFIWAGVCIVAPVAGKLISGINNYNDYLKLTDAAIEYKNNNKTGVYALKEVSEIRLVRDDNKVLHKIQLLLSNKEEITIDLDEMELEAFMLAIDEFITEHYKGQLQNK